LKKWPCIQTLCSGSPVFSWHWSQLQSSTEMPIWRIAFGQTKRSQGGSAGKGFGPM
jgi:hypothetical protein